MPDRVSDPRSARLRSHRVAVAAILALALAAATVRQESGPNHAAHYALVRALASGIAEIDPRETIDAAFVDGRYYAAKAPGLAMLAPVVVLAPPQLTSRPFWSALVAGAAVGGSVAAWLWLAARERPGAARRGHTLTGVEGLQC